MVWCGGVCKIFNNNCPFPFWSFGIGIDMASSRERARLISSVASAAYFLVVIFQVPLFRVPCGTGICKSPLEITSSQLIASALFPKAVVKGLLYPGAILSSVIENRTLPCYGDLLHSYGLSDIREAPAAMDLQHIEILAGSYFMVVGAFVSLIKPLRVSFFGALLITWGLASEIISTKTAQTSHPKSIHVYPTMVLAIVFGFFSIRKDVRKILRTCKDWRCPINLRQKLL